VAHTNNPSYSGGRNQKDHSRQIVHETLFGKKTITKRSDEVTHGVGSRWLQTPGPKKKKTMIKYKTHRNISLKKNIQDFCT
jgi:hypothetical protein